MTTIACGSASGFVVPPVFILPGKTVKLDILKGCQVPGAAVTATPSGFLTPSCVGVPTSQRTHLFQPLEVAVFASFKGRLRVLVNEFVDEDDHGGYSIDKSSVKGKKRKTANVSGQIRTAEMMKKMEQKEHKKTKKTTVKTDTDMKKTGAAKSTKGAKLVDPTNTAAAVNTTRSHIRGELTTHFAWRHTLLRCTCGDSNPPKYNGPQ
ncbi:hypothetical protein GQ600_23503 [Phytophthora cactorum]|nr:hypothetical protein GQ600_23503 [Phytophthora cactorum]